MGFKNSCGCCSCGEDRPVFSDDFSTTKTGYTDTASSFYVDSGRLNTTADGSYFRQITRGSTHNMRMVLRCKMWQGEDMTRVGMYIGGLCSMYIEKLISGVFRLYLGTGVDQFGNNPTETYDLIFPAYPGGISGGFNAMLEIEHDWIDGSNHYFIKATGSVIGQFSAEVTSALPATFNVGMMGDGGQWDDFFFSKSTSANRCISCIKPACIGQELPKQLLLSVPELVSLEGGCNCEQLSGDWILNYKTYANVSPCVFRVQCCWRSDAMGGCGTEGADPCGLGNIWQLYAWAGAARLVACNTSEWLEYRITQNGFNCDGPTTLTYFSPFGFEGCATKPLTLTVVPI